MTESGGAIPALALTGGTGFVGGHLLRRAVAAGWRVRALARGIDRLPLKDPAVTAIAGDLASPEALAELVAGADAVIHCAGLVAAGRRADFARVNVEGTANLLRAAAAVDRPPRFLLVSSLAAREPRISAYANSKFLAEERLRELGGGLECQALRAPVVYGPGDTATLGLFRQFKRGFALRPAGAGRFSMIYVEDLADALIGLLTVPPLQPLALEVDDGQVGGYGWDEVLAAAGRQLQRDVRGIAVPRPLQRAVAAAATAAALLRGRAAVLSQDKVNELAHPDWVCRHARLSDLTPWRPRVGLDEGFSRTLDWYSAQGWL